MAITDFLIGKKGIERQKNKAIDFARERYDPSVFNPQVEYSRRRATEGLYAGEENLARGRTIESLFRDDNYSAYGGNQGMAIAGAGALDESRQNALANFEGQLTSQDIQARQRGERGLAQAQSQQRQIQSQRDASIKEAELQAETAVEQRKNQLKATVGKLVGTAAGLATGNPFLGAAIGGVAGGALSGGGGALSGAGAGLQAGYISGQNKGSATPQQPQKTTPTTDNSAIDNYNIIMGKSGFGKIIADLPQGQPQSRNVDTLFTEPQFGGLQPVDIGPARDVSQYANFQLPQQQPQTQQPTQTSFSGGQGATAGNAGGGATGGAGGKDRNVDTLFKNPNNFNVEYPNNPPRSPEAKEFRSLYEKSQGQSLSKKEFDRLNELQRHMSLSNSKGTFNPELMNKVGSYIAYPFEKIYDALTPQTYQDYINKY